MATTLKELLDSLPESERGALEYSFENGLTYYVMLDNERYIGVNTRNVAHLIPDMEKSVGVWSVGKVAGASK